MTKQQVWSMKTRKIFKDCPGALRVTLVLWLAGLCPLAAQQELAAQDGRMPRPSQFQQLHVGSICRVKGQERNTLQGMGLVTGLNGTGDGAFGPMTRSLMAANGTRLGGARFLALAETSVRPGSS